MLVIGGGITGCGVALDAAARGLRTALVEAEDFASGTSSKSSKLVHGGLRYLQQHDYRLVYEALARAPAPPRTTRPTWCTRCRSSSRCSAGTAWCAKGVARAYSVALWLYDVTGGLRIGKRHRRIDAAEALAHLPRCAPTAWSPASCTGTPRPTTPASPWRWPAPPPRHGAVARQLRAGRPS